MTPYDYAWAYVSAIAGDPNTAVMDWRALHDTDKSDPGHPQRGTLPNLWQWLTAMNERGYGIFVTPAMMDGAGRKLDNVSALRANYADLDNVSAQQNYERAAALQPVPSFAVQSSPGKYHVYWVTQPYTGNDRFTLIQRKLRQLYDADNIIDATRVMRCPGFYHRKGEPYLVTCHALGAFGQPYTVEALETALAHVNVIDGGNGTRHPLGTPDMAAPSIEWVQRALDLIDPNDLDRGEWIAVTSGVKQAGWSLTDCESLFAMWSKWCERYDANDRGENHKQWHSLRDTEVGWSYLTRKVPALQAALSFGGQQVPAPAAAQGDTVPPMPSVASPPPLDCSGEYLTHLECEQYFAGCAFIVKMGKILAPDGRFHNATTFNGAYGGKQFIITSDGKKTDEAWKAALRSTLWTIPKVDHIRFLPQQPQGAIVKDALGRSGVNMYAPPQVQRIEGDASPFLNHLARLIPDTNDQRILHQWMAHIVQYPGYKIPWAPVIQSAEGAGKTMIEIAMTHAVGAPYVHFPNAQELADGGGKFNAWMRNKVFILADEIKVDERLHLVEVLKPLLTRETIEIQGKGHDQDMEDNPACWGFFTNYKDAIPAKKNGRRYAIFYSPIQTASDLIERGMNDEYFKPLFEWMRGDGKAIVADWLLSYPIERGAIPMRAPETTSTAEAVNLSRSPIERAISEAVEQQLPGFVGGWISSVAVMQRLKKQSVTRGQVSPHIIAGILESMGYVDSGRALQGYFAENPDEPNARATLYHWGERGDVSGYAAAQGYST